jgi:hypothetical protein
MRHEKFREDEKTDNAGNASVGERGGFSMPADVATRVATKLTAKFR